MRELWKPLDEFSGYAVSNFGDVVNLKRDHIVKPCANHQGIATVGLFANGVHTTRSVSLLVADAFLPRPNDIFNSPINLDGDRMHCHVDNLLWRPRWYAVLYHRQFRSDEFFDSDPELEVVETGERYRGFVEPCVTYGIRYIDIILSYTNNKPTFPTGQHYIRHN